ncbi:CYTH domain-containing protein [Microbacterium sp. Y-01]|uniref:CYTH domain-containing protein n=1 Tax=Microbacterium TaxID=33882 RepID=UPI0002F94B99|nr:MULTISPECIES: CYTH domain-containing protein [Microbacterium]AZH78934.1 CYTH domain-containing protein [Microbacterium sp. Y-01]
MTEPSRSVEVERKFDVDDSTPLPDWAGIPGVDTVTAGEVRILDARYFDTADGELARAGVALRRRSGGPDEGWHVKGPRQGDGRLELGWPLGEGEEIPASVVAAVSEWSTGVLTPLARIRNDRTAYLLLSGSDVVAEFVDDRVRATDLRHDVQREWREWEVELGPAAPREDAARAAFFEAVERAVLAAGGRPAGSDSKLARALGF